MKVDGVEVIVPTLLLEKGEYSLSEWLDKGSDDTVFKKYIVEQVARIVTFLHECGIVHLDIRPANLVFFLAEHGISIIKIIDFDCAREVKDVVGDVLSYEYSAPERWKSHREGKKGEAAAFSMDIWSLGVVICRIFNTHTTGELMLSSSRSDYTINSKVVDSIIDSSFKDALLSDVNKFESKAYDLLNKYILVEEGKRDKTMTDVMKHGYFNLHAISGVYGVVNYLLF